MPRLDYKWCKNCNGHAATVGPLSHNGLCLECGNLRRKEAALQLNQHSGPKFDTWRRKHAAAVGAVLIDDLPPEWQRALAAVAAGAIASLDDVALAP